jgi:hypothetical protein
MQEKLEKNNFACKLPIINLIKIVNLLIKRWSQSKVGANRGLIRGSLYFYIEIFSPKKTWFSPIKNTFQNFFDICLPLFYATFQCGP